MADTQPKRPRDQEELFSCEMEISKRQKNSYNQILSILDDNTEDEPTQDLTDFFTALQQELSSQLAIESTETVKEEENDTDKEMVIRHLLEASDDELGLPNRDVAVAGDEDEVPAGKDGGLPVAVCDGVWDLEDDAANYFSLLHPELIM